MNHFFLMGCWNDDHCEGLDYRKAVIDEIIKHKSEYNYGILAGDNIYQHGNTYYKKTLDYGFQELLKTQLPLYTILGNHDVHKESILKAHLELNEQRKIILPYNCYVHYLPNLRLIMIDTNLLTPKQDKGGIYQKLLSKYPSFFRVNTAEKLLNNLNYELKKPFDGWTIVLGHEPLLSYKLKKDQLKLTNLSHVETLLELLSKSPKTIYISADVHSFQVINLPYEKHILPMIVAGTGGADPDINPELSSQLSYTIYGKEYTFQMTAENPSYGYVSIEYDKQNLKVYYHPLKGCSEGQSMLELCYKNKQLQLKNQRKITKKTCNAKPAVFPLCIDQEPPME